MTTFVTALAVLAAVCATAATAEAKPVYYTYRLAPVDASGVRGVTTLTRSPSTRSLWVSVIVRGAEPGSILLARIGTGPCVAPRTTRWRLREMNVNELGRAHGYTRILRVAAFGPGGPRGLHLVILSRDGTRVSCGTIGPR